MTIPEPNDMKPIPPCMCPTQDAAITCPRWHRQIVGGFYSLCQGQGFPEPTRSDKIRAFGWEATAEKLKAQFPQMPSLWRRAGNLGRAMVQHVKTGLAIVSNEIEAERQASCEACVGPGGFFDAKKKVCRHPDCGCNMHIKWRFTSSKCPIGKWDAVTDTPEMAREPYPDELDDRIAKPDLRGATSIPAKPSLFNAHMQAVNLRDFLRGGKAVFLGRGPSLAAVDLERLKDPALVTIGVNNVTEVFPVPTVWLCVDPPVAFPGPHWTTSRCLKLIPAEFIDHVIPGVGRVGDQPATVFYIRNARFRAERFLTEPTWNYGCDADATDDAGQCCGRSVMLPMFKAAWFLGIKRLALLGCDFRMDGSRPYVDRAGKEPPGVATNNDAYRILDARFARLRPVLETAGLAVANATEGSDLTAFDRMNLDDFIRS